MRNFKVSVGVLFGVFAFLLLSSAGYAEVKTRTVEYKDGDVVCKGFVAVDDAKSGPRPGVLVVPEWWGLDDYAKGRARQLAELGYYAFAIDMYGDGKVTQDPKEAAKLAAIRDDRPKLRARALAGLKAMTDTAEATLDRSKIAAIGYCFGGTTVIELARSGADLAGVVSFHGGLEMPGQPADTIKAKFLICTGAADPMVPIAQVDALENQLSKAKADFQIVRYSGAMHSFTNPSADKHGIPGIAYNESADHRSWAAMKDFFDELFK